MSKNILVLGASGQIANHVIRFLQENNNLNLTLFMKNANRYKGEKNDKTSIIEGDVLNPEQLNEAMKGQDIVYANLAGSVDEMAKAIVSSMEHHNVSRLIFVTSLGIYHEIPGAFGKWNNQMIGGALKGYRRAADIIESSNLEYTVVRPAWLTNNDEVNFETTQKNEPFRGTEVSRKSVGSYIADVIQNPEKDVNASVGINKPGTEGDKPSFY